MRSETKEEPGKAPREAQRHEYRSARGAALQVARCLVERLDGLLDRALLVALGGIAAAALAKIAGLLP